MGSRVLSSAQERRFENILFLREIMKVTFVILTFLMASEAAKLVEEFVLREGHQKNRQERRFENKNNVIQQQEIEFVYEEPGGRSQNSDDNEVIQEEIVIVQETDSKPTTPNSAHKGLVPQLWPNYTGPVEPAPETVACNVAWMKCGFREGCRFALENYNLGCLDLVKGKTQVCNTYCKHSLIALMSTHEGQRLMKCNCSGDSNCEQSKLNIRPCQDEVLEATKPDSIVACTTAHWICSADKPCKTALEWYNYNCQSMFKGKQCSARCKNSLNILKKQEAASKLETCYCDGSEDFDCVNIKTNMEELCYRETNEIDDEKMDNKSGSTSSAWIAKAERILVIVTIFATIFFNWIGASFNIMVDTVQEMHQEPAAPPEEIGVH